LKVFERQTSPMEAKDTIRDGHKPKSKSKFVMLDNLKRAK